MSIIADINNQAVKFFNEFVTPMSLLIGKNKYDELVKEMMERETGRPLILSTDQKIVYNHIPDKIDIIGNTVTIVLHPTEADYWGLRASPKDEILRKEQLKIIRA